MASRKFGLAQRIQEKTLKRQRKLRRQQVDRSPVPLGGRPAGSSSAFAEPGEMEKMSEVLDRFVQPYMKLATTEAGVRNIYSYGAAAWNASLLSVNKQKEMIDRVLQEHQLPDEGQIVVRSLLQDMIERKQAYFAADGRVIIDYILKDTGDGFDLSVIALLPKPPA